jgi:hypothetical protein
MIPAGPLFHKPQSFISAKNLLYTRISVGVYIILLHKLILGNSDNGMNTGLGLITAEYIIMFFMVKQMSLCKKWARTIVLIICVLVAASYIFIFKIESKVSMAEVALFVLQAAFQLVALIFLYTIESNTWFNSRTNNTLP